jgi:nucleotide-binding universal stress UspA family protein
MIPQIKKILYATDLSKNSVYAFFFVVDMARKRDARIIILHAIEPVPPYLMAYEESISEMQRKNVDEAIEEIQKRLNDFCERVETKMGAPCRSLVSNIVVRVGYPVEEILNMAKEEGCDLTILGSHGKGFLQQTFLGSVSRSVLDRTRKPIFIIPLPPEKTDLDWDKML